jgi:hypothetical protein
MIQRRLAASIPDALHIYLQWLCQQRRKVKNSNNILKNNITLSSDDPGDIVAGLPKMSVFDTGFGEWRQLLYIKKTALVFTCLANNRYEVQMNGTVRFWPIADPNFNQFLAI